MGDEPIGTNDDLDANNEVAIPDDDAPVGMAITDGGTTVTLSYLIETEAHDPANPPGSATEANLVPNGYTSTDDGELSVTFTGVKIAPVGTSDAAPFFAPGEVSLRNTGSQVADTIKVRPEPDAPNRTPLKVGAGAGAAVIAALVFLLGTGGDEGASTPERPRVATTTTIAAAATEPVTPAAAAEPAVELERFTATFDPASYTTTYDAVLTVDARELDITWELRPHEDCGVFDSFDGRATWTHPHESQRGQVPGFPDDRYCQDPQGTTGHTGEVVVRFGSAGTVCEYAYPGGSVDGVVDRPATTCR